MSAPPVSLTVTRGYLGVDPRVAPADKIRALFTEYKGKKILSVNSRLPQGHFHFSIFRLPMSWVTIS
jgi:hypothetical protein